jgi:two-component system sensor histidine kinase KdpD
VSESQIPAASRISAAVDNRLVRVALIVVALVAATVAAVVLEDNFRLADASPVFLVAVVLAAGLLGTTAAVVTSVASFLTYDFLFTTPRFTFAVSDPAEWLSLLLFLLVAVVIGRLTALLSERVEMAERRARESVALVAISGEVAMASSFAEAAERIVERLCLDTEMRAMWITLDDDPDTIVAVAGPPPKAGPLPWTLVRTDVDGTSDWLRLREAPSDSPAITPAVQPVATSSADAGERYVVAIEGTDGPVGWIGAARDEGDPRPGRGARRLLVLAADQLAIAHRRDALQAELTEAEVARQSDRLRAAILDSVSHDLRTPIASIRALAGGLEDAAADADPAAVRSAAAAIDHEGARLGELVNGLLDLGRIQAGAVKPSLEPFDLAELVESSVRRERAAGGTPRLAVEVSEDLPPVLVDEVLFQAALGNVVDNALQHAAGSKLVRIRASAPTPGKVRLEIDDDGPGVPADALPHLFDRFYRVAPAAEPARQGLGIGLAIARGFVEAMDGSIEAEASDLGGLRIRMTLPAVGGEGDA